jgi:sugar O-acyltransferase (sialic acid O-acetyltransferase NeuD family)
MENIILIGGGGHCKSCIDVIESTKKYKIAGIIDMPEKVGSKVFDYSVIGTDDQIPELVEKYKNFFITIGQIGFSERRVIVFNLLKKLNANLPVIISAESYVSRHCSIGEGTIIMHNAVVNADAKIGCNCIINTAALIEHDAEVREHCHVSTGAIINGGTIVNKYSFIGSNAICVEYKEISEKSFIKAGSVFKG